MTVRFSARAPVSGETFGDIVADARSKAAQLLGDRSYYLVIDDVEPEAFGADGTVTLWAGVATIALDDPIPADPRKKR